MRNSSLPTRQPLSELLKIAITPAEKHAAFETAAKHGLTASDFVRAALSALTTAEDDERRQMIAKALVR